MAQNNDNGGNEFAMVFGLIGMVAFTLAAFIYAALVFVAIVGAVVALVAILFDGIEIGDFEMSRHDGSAFFVRGVLGAVALPMFLILFAALLGGQAPPEVVLHGTIAGFAIGSVGLPLFILYHEREQAASLPARHAPKAIEIEALPAPREERPSQSQARCGEKPCERKMNGHKTPFEYASWDDEQEFKQ